MSFFKHFIPLKAKVWVSLDKPQFAEGEQVTGKVSATAEDYIQAQEVRIEARVFQNYEEMVWVTLPNNQRVQQREHRQDTLFSHDARISGPSDFGKGPQRDFPFQVGIPTFRPTRAGGTIQYSVKGVIAVKGRPDVTGATGGTPGPSWCSHGRGPWRSRQDRSLHGRERWRSRQDRWPHGRERWRSRQDWSCPPPRPSPGARDAPDETDAPDVTDARDGTGARGATPASSSSWRGQEPWRLRRDRSLHGRERWRSCQDRLLHGRERWRSRQDRSLNGPTRRR